ncbi:MAG: peptidylprolyl isomerase [Candidatus Puniceispirillales bacterium]
MIDTPDRSFLTVILPCDNPYYMIAVREDYNRTADAARSAGRPSMACSISSPLRAVKHLIAAGLATALLTAPAMAQEEEALTILTINGQPYSLNLVGSLINQLPENVRARPLESYYDSIVDDIIDTRLTADAARESGLADNVLLKEIADRARDRVLAEAWINQTVNERITEEMIEQSYNDYVADAESRTEVRARHILVDTEDAAKAVIGRLDGGEDFAAIAREVSTGPSGPNGGELGYFRRGAMVPAFELAAFAVAKGSYTQAPVQTQFGWHVIMVEDRRVAPAPPLEEMRDQLINTLSVKMVSTIISELRSQVEITRLNFDEVREAETKRRENAAQ